MKFDETSNSIVKNMKSTIKTISDIKLEYNECKKQALRLLANLVHNCVEAQVNYRLINISIVLYQVNHLFEILLLRTN
jgi:hypothetical protein